MLRVIIYPLGAAAFYILGVLFLQAPDAVNFAFRQYEPHHFRVVPEFYDLAERDYPIEFEATLGSPRHDSPKGALRLGQVVYAREGCYECHTQQVRAGTYDVRRWGAPHRAREYDEPWHSTPMVGARRVGPDLGREANRRSNDWHAAHLYMPGVIVPGSIMPAFPWLFEERNGRVVPNREGLAIIVYLQSLGSDIDEDNR